MCAVPCAASRSSAAEMPSPTDIKEPSCASGTAITVARRRAPHAGYDFDRALLTAREGVLVQEKAMKGVRGGRGPAPAGLLADALLALRAIAH